MQYALGFISGILLVVVVFQGIILLCLPIERVVRRTERKLATIAPHAKGFIIEPESEAEQVRQRIIERNRKQGKDTKLTELYEDTKD